MFSYNLLVSQTLWQRVQTRESLACLDIKDPLKPLRPSTMQLLQLFGGRLNASEVVILLISFTENIKAIRRTAVRETSVSKHHWGTIKGPVEDHHTKGSWGLDATQFPLIIFLASETYPTFLYAKLIQIFFRENIYF